MRPPAAALAFAAAVLAACGGPSTAGEDPPRSTTAPAASAEEAASSTTTEPEPEPEHRYLLGTSDELATLPTSGPAWDALVATAEQDLVPDLADQDRTSSAAFAAALVYARTGDERHRLRVVDALARLPGTEEGGRTLSLGRQLAGWVLAADLVGYRDEAFLQWLDGVRTAEIGGHGRWRTLTQTHEDTATNWGALAGASRIAASRFLGDDADVERAAEVLRGWLGEDGGAPWPGLPVDADDGQHGFVPSQDFDRSWACAYPSWTAVNAACGERDGALVEDISRGEAFPSATEVGLQYTWEALQGVVLQAMLLAADGRSEVWSWGDEALRRAVDFLAREGGFDSRPYDPLHHWVPWAVDAAYATAYAAGPAGAGRSVGFTDWLAPLITAHAPRGR
jgi:hypothetical protein